MKVMRPYNAIIVCGDCWKIEEKADPKSVGHDKKVKHWCKLIKRVVDPKKFDKRCELKNRVAVPI